MQFSSVQIFEIISNVRMAKSLAVEALRDVIEEIMTLQKK